MICAPVKRILILLFQNLHRDNKKALASAKRRRLYPPRYHSFSAEPLRHFPHLINAPPCNVGTTGFRLLAAFAGSAACSGGMNMAACTGSHQPPALCSRHIHACSPSSHFVSYISYDNPFPAVCQEIPVAVFHFFVVFGSIALHRASGPRSTLSRIPASFARATP